MKTIEIKVYEFDELSEQAKQKAINILRERARQACEQYCGEASESIRKLEEIAHVKTDIRYSSQGFYTRWCEDTNPDYELTDEQAFDKFKKDFEEQFKGDIWSDDLLCDVVTNHEFNGRISYKSNICAILIKYCEKVELGTLCYYEDDYVKEWIEDNEFMFFEDGRPIIDELL